MPGEIFMLTLLKQLSKVPVIRRWAKKKAYQIARQTDKDLICTIFTGHKMLLHLRDWVQYHLFLYGYYEKEESVFWLNFAKGNNKVIFDIGANVGYFTLLATKNAVNNSRIYAFEPITRTVQRLKDNLSLNKCGSSVTVEKLAVGKSSSTLTLHIGNQYNWGMSSVNRHEESSTDTEIITCVAIDEYVRLHKIQKIDLMKIDVEGAEFDAVSGMQETLTNLRPIVLIELLDAHLEKQGHHSSEIYPIFFDLDYEAWEILPGKRLKKIHSPRSYDGLVCFFPAEKEKGDYSLSQ
jgi:FkbM family methyltransferase